MPRTADFAEKKEILPSEQPDIRTSWMPSLP